MGPSGFSALEDLWPGILPGGLLFSTLLSSSSYLFN